MKMRHVSLKSSVLLLAGLILSLVTTAADADSGFCSQLQGQYLALGQQTYQDSYPVDQARAAYENVRNQARAAGCLGVLSIFTHSRQCPAILSRLRQVQNTYARYGGNFGFLGFGQSDTQSQRDRLRQTLLTYGCSIPSSGGFRTVCVRTCDGYYFPISFATNRSRFKTDAALCQSIYPDGQAQLYVYQNPGEEAEQMISVDGEPYASQPYAFAYRGSYNPACAAQLATGLAAFGKASQAFARQVASNMPLMPLPRARPADGEDPETLADAEGGLSLSTDLAPPVADAGRVVADARPPAVRTVGPSYYYAEPIHLQSLGRKPPRASSGFSFISPAEAAERPEENATPIVPQ
jgi:hypothetical protein